MGLDMTLQPRELSVVLEPEVNCVWVKELRCVRCASVCLPSNDCIVSSGSA